MVQPNQQEQPKLEPGVHLHNWRDRRGNDYVTITKVAGNGFAKGVGIPKSKWAEVQAAIAAYDPNSAANMVEGATVHIP